MKWILILLGWLVVVGFFSTVRGLKEKLGFVESEQELEEVVRSSREAQKNKSPRSLEELLEVIQKAENSWRERGILFREFAELQELEIESWSLEEVKLVCMAEDAGDWLSACFGRWGKDDHEGALEFALSLRDDCEDRCQEIRDRGQRSIRELEVAEMLSDETGAYINAILAGWSEVDPRAAWEIIAMDVSGIASSESFSDGYGYLAPIKIFEQLSKKDADYALEEFVKYPEDSFRGSMLKGMVLGLPEGQDWKGIFEMILDSPRSDHREIVAVLRGGLLGRWMAEDAEKAVEWFRSEGGEAISWRSIEVYERQDEDPFASDSPEPEKKMVEIEVSVAGGLRHWLSKDVHGASRWLADHQELVPEVLGKGSGLDEANVAGEDLRSMLVLSLDQQQREDVLKAAVGKSALANVINSEDEARLRKQIAELQLSREFSVELFHLHRANEADPFGDD